jgi:streptogramin lyase
VAPDGHVWFDVLDGWFLYEVDPATDAFRLHDISESPRPGQPWGYVRMIDDNGHQRYRELRDSSEVAQLPDSLRSRISRFRVRGAAKRMALDARGNVWLTDWGRDRVVRYDPERGALTEYPSLPRPAEPYGIAVRSTDDDGHDPAVLLR